MEFIDSIDINICTDAIQFIDSVCSGELVDSIECNYSTDVFIEVRDFSSLDSANSSLFWGRLPLDGVCGGEGVIGGGKGGEREAWWGGGGGAPHEKQYS